MSSIKRNLHVAVVGPPGSGKTTYINRATKGEYVNTRSTTTPIVNVYTNSELFENGLVRIHLHETPNENFPPLGGWDAALIFAELRLDEEGNKCVRPFSSESDLMREVVPPTRTVLVLSKADVWNPRYNPDTTDTEQAFAHIHPLACVTSSLAWVQVDRPLSLIVRMFDSQAAIVNSPPIQPPTVG